MKRNGQMKHIGGGGRTTASSVPGGLFAPPPEPHSRDRMDGRAGGRGNSSSIVGGIFGGEAPNLQQQQPEPLGADRLRRHQQFQQQQLQQQQQQQQQQPPSRHATSSSISGGIFGSSEHHTTVVGTASAWDGAAGGRATNAAQVLGHRRANFNGEAFNEQGYAGGRTNNVQQHLFGYHRGGHAPLNYAQQQPNVTVPSDDFLSALEQAEQRDNEDQRVLEALEAEQLALQEQAAADEHMIAAAAAQIAAEQGLGPEQQRALEATLRAKLQAQAARGVVPTSQQHAVYGGGEEECDEYEEEEEAAMMHTHMHVPPAEQQKLYGGGYGGGYGGAAGSCAAGAYRGAGGAARRDPNASTIVLA